VEYDVSPTLAVLITYCDERELLTECIESLTLQAPLPDEIIVYDDASEFPAADYVPPLPNLRIIRGETRQGPSRGRNVLLAAAGSDYIHFQDTDDHFDPRWSRRIREVIDDSAPDAIFVDIALYRNGEMLTDHLLDLSRLHAGEDLMQLSLDVGIRTTSGVYRRQVVQTIGGYREDLWQCEDFDFHVRLAASGVSYVALDQPLIRMHMRAASRSQNSREVWLDFLKSLEFLLDSGTVAPRYQADLADAFGRAGMYLFHVRAYSEGRRAFRRAKSVGPPSYRYQGRFFRGISRTLGPEVTEWMRTTYRAAIPSQTRTAIRGRFQDSHSRQRQRSEPRCEPPAP
jgi:GT2 family glycosyltransferase